MQITALQINELLKGELIGDPTVIVSKPAKIEEAQAGDIAFLANIKYEQFAYSTNASILLINDTFEPRQPITATLIKVNDAYQAFTQLLTYYQSIHSQSKEGIEPHTHIDPTATIGEKVFVGAFSTIQKNATLGQGTQLIGQVYIGENVIIGQNCTLHAGVKIYANCILKNDVIIHSNTVIGSDGFGFAPNADGSYTKIPQLGNVVIGNHVEIGSNTCIDRATMGSTVIEDGVKLDNLIQIAHNVVVGKNTAIAAQSGISGSTKIGDNNIIGGQVGIVGHITTANKVKIQAQSGINKSITTEGQALYGSPALEYKDFIKSYVVFRKLPELQKKLDELTKK